MADYYDYDILDEDEAAAEMALGALEQAREYAAGAGYDPDEFVAEYLAGASIEGDYLSGALGARTRATTRGSRRTLRTPGRTLGSRGLRAPTGRLSLAALRGAMRPIGGMRALGGLRAVPVGLPGAVVPSAPGPVDTSYLPLVSPAAIAAGASATITQTSQTIFKPHRLNVPRNIADFFLIDAFSVGNVPLSAAAGQVPASSFATDATGANVRKVTAQPGVQIVLQVTNIDGAAHRFLSTLFGASSQPEGCRA